MTDQEFITAIEAYYGKYTNRHIRASVLNFIGQFSNISQIYSRLITEFSGQYKYVPDVAIIKKMIDKIREDDPFGVYRKGKRIGYLDGDRFIPDLSLLPQGGIKIYKDGYLRYNNPDGYMRLLNIMQRKYLSEKTHADV